MDNLASLAYIKISNFKTYKGDVIIGPLLKLTIVFGKNGLGKSNFLDAIAFLMGATLETLRASTLSSLIYGGNVNKYNSDRASVMACINLRNGRTRQFCRMVILQGNDFAVTEFIVDDEVVSREFYMGELQKLGISKNLENMCIFHGNVQSFVRMSPKNITTLIEDISGSGNMRREYNQLLAEVKKFEENLKELTGRKKLHISNRKQIKSELNVLQDHTNLTNNLENLKLQLILMKLYHNEKECRKSNTQRKEIENKLKDLEKQKLEFKTKPDKQRIIQLQNQIFEVEEKLSGVENKLVKASEEQESGVRKLEQLRNKLQTCTASLEYEERTISKQRSEIQKIENELVDVQKIIDDFEETVSSQGTSLQLEEENVQRYNMLKEIAGGRLTKHRQQFNKVTMEKKSEQEKLDSALFKKAQIDHQIKALKTTCDDIDNQLQKVNSLNSNKETNLREKMKMRDELQTKGNTAKLELEKVEKELEILVKKLEEMNFRNDLFLRQQKNLRVVDDLRITFGENVLGLMSELCQPVHERYKLAITKVMGSNLEALVVKNRQTGVEVIKYLKYHHLPPMYILPLDNLKVKPVADKLRKIGDSTGKNVKLLVDQVMCKYSSVELAVQYAVSYWLVADSDADGREVAYQSGNGERYDVVTLDGTCYSKNGTVSCGKATLEEKAKRWIDADLLEAQNRKMNLRAKLQELKRDAAFEHKLKNMSQEVSSLEIVLKYIKEKQNLLEDNLNKSRSRLEDINNEAAENDVIIASIKQKLGKYDAKILEIQNEMNEVEDSVFADFCSEIGIPNIRVYEGVSLREYQERMQRKKELDSLKQNILNEIEYMKGNLNSKMASSKMKEIQDSLKAELREKQDKLVNDKKDKEKYLKECSDLKSEIRKLKNELFAAKEKDAKDMEQIKKLMNNIRQSKTLSQVIQSKIEDLIATRHRLLAQSKADELFLPMKHGSMVDIQSIDSSDLSDSSNMYRTEIILDYSGLESNFRNTDNVEATEKELTDRIEVIRSLINETKPNMKAPKELDKVKVSLGEIELEISSVFADLQRTTNRFNEVKQERKQLFMTCFKSIATEIDKMYKNIYETGIGKAILTPENTEEPYLGGVRYAVQVPGKKCIAMDCLSGGEATMASVVFLFVMNRYRKVPILLLDEPDEALDKKNVLRFATFLKKIDDMQIIITSHSNKYAYANAANDLLAISKKIEDGLLISKSLLPNIDKYPINLNTSI